MAAPGAPPSPPPLPPLPPSPPATVPPPPPRPPRPPKCGNTQNTLLPVEATTSDEAAQAACQRECEWQQAERGPGVTIDPKPYAGAPPLLTLPLTPLLLLADPDAVMPV